jgi:glycosyltransferase involved in cell wall biosynthesis
MNYQLAAAKFGRGFFMPRLLILCEYPTLLGGERSMLSTLPAVLAAGFEVHVAAPPGGPLAAAIGESGATNADWTTAGERGVRRPLDELRADLLKLIRRIEPDLVHANSLSMARIAGPVAVSAGVPSIGHLRDIIKVSEQVVVDLNCHTRLIAVSQATRDYHVAQGLDAAKCIAIHNGVDMDAFRPRPATGYLHRELRLPPRARLIATIGQIGLRKATDVVLAAAFQIADRLPDVHWLIVGERTSEKDESIEFERQLHDTAAKPPLVGRVHFLGQRDDAATLLKECSILVHAARQEPLSRVLLEAAASGVPVVATGVGGTREIFPTEADGGLLVPADNHDALAQAIVALCNNDNRRMTLGHAGRRRAETAFDVRAAAARLLDEYQSLL